MNDEQLREGPRMDDAFRARMRRGLSSMAVRERTRERRRNRAIAGGALTAVVIAAVAVIGSQALATMQPERDRAAPPVTTAPQQTPSPSPEPPGPVETTPESEPPEPTSPAGFEGIAAGEPTVIDVESCSYCGDAAPAGGPKLERIYDIYLLCEGTGSVAFGGEPWVDCTEHPAGTGFVLPGLVDTVDDGDPQYTPSSDFDGQLIRTAPAGPAVGARPGSTASVWVTCLDSQSTVTVGGVVFDCSAAEAPEGELVTGATIAAWGVPIAPGEFAPRVELGTDSAATVSFVVER